MKRGPSVPVLPFPTKPEARGRGGVSMMEFAFYRQEKLRATRRLVQIADLIFAASEPISEAPQR